MSLVEGSTTLTVPRCDDLRGSLFFWLVFLCRHILFARVLKLQFKIPNYHAERPGDAI